MPHNDENIIAFAVSLVTVLYLQISGSEIFRIISCCYFSAYCLAYQVDSEKLLDKLRFIFIFGTAGSIMTGFTCALLSKYLFVEAVSWPGAVGMIGTGFITHFRKEIPVWIKDSITSFVGIITSKKR